MSEKNVTIIKFDPWSIIKVLAIFFLIFLLWVLKDIILLLFLAIVIVAIIGSSVDALEKKGVPRVLGTLLIYILILIVLFAIIVPLIPIISQQFGVIVERIYGISAWLESYQVIGQLKLIDLFKSILKFDQFNLEEGFFSLISSFTGLIIFIFMTLVVAFYITVQKNSLTETIKTIVPKKYKEFSINLIRLIQKDLGHWARGELILMFFVGLLTYVGLTILNIRYALILAILAGLLEVIPWFGPWLSAIPAVLVALAISPLKAVLVAFLYLIVQQTENTLLVPNIMKKAVGLNPLLVIIILMIGGKLGGLLGVILAVPITTIFMIIIEEYNKLRNT